MTQRMVEVYKLIERIESIPIRFILYDKSSQILANEH